MVRVEPPGCSQARSMKVQICEDPAGGSRRETLTQTPGNTSGNCERLGSESRHSRGPVLVEGTLAECDRGSGGG